jgi:undecaprenyl-diphosphatase
MPAADETLLLGLLHGPAELLPISSSAHVGLLPWALRWDHAALPAAERKEVEVALHAGTALVLAFERRPIRWAFLAAATAPPALAGLAFERAIETRLGTPPTVALGLVAGAIAMVVADRAPAGRREPTIVDGLLLGAAQALALIPGVSRSGATRAAARWRGFGRADAATLSREVALPVLAGAAALKALRRPSRGALPALAAGAAASAASTWAALRLERSSPPLAVFAAYRVVLAAAIVAVWRSRRDGTVRVRGVWHDRAR